MKRNYLLLVYVAALAAGLCLWPPAADGQIMRGSPSCSIFTSNSKQRTPCAQLACTGSFPGGSSQCSPDPLTQRKQICARTSWNCTIVRALACSTDQRTASYARQCGSTISDVSITIICPVNCPSNSGDLAYDGYPDWCGSEVQSTCFDSNGTWDSSCNCSPQCPTQQYECVGDGWYWDEWDCGCVNWYASPILVDLNGDGFALTDAAGGVEFDLDTNYRKEKISWTAPGADDAWLVLDQDRNGVINHGAEMFGNFTPQPTSSEPNGFLALSVFDEARTGGNGDGVIDARDAVFADLRLWRDDNHNGVSEPGELHGLADAGLDSVSLAYKESKRKDAHGNAFRYRAKVRDAAGHQLGRWAWDVFLTRAR